VVRVGRQSFENGVDRPQAGPVEQGLLVGDPFTAAGQHAVRGLRGGDGDEPGRLGDVTAGGVGLACVAQRHLGVPAPPLRRGDAQLARVFRAGQAAAQHAVLGQFGDHDVGRDAGQVEHQGLDAEASLDRLGDPVLDVVQVTVVDVDLAVLHPEPGAAVEHPAAPAADREDLAGPAQGAQVVGVEMGAVVQGEIPVAVWPVGSGGPGAA